MLIDGSQLLEELIEYIGDVDPIFLRGDLFMGLKDEEATRPSVLREWFFLVCREIFNPQNTLFVVFPNDRRRFLPNLGLSKLWGEGIEGVQRKNDNHISLLLKVINWQKKKSRICSLFSMRSTCNCFILM